MAFGDYFLKHGKFNKKGRKAIRKAGFASGTEFRNSLGDGTQTTQTLADALARGPQKPDETVADQAAPAEESEAPPANPAEGLVAQGADMSSQGRQIMTRPMKAESNLYNQGSTMFGRGQNFFGDMFKQANFAQDPRLGQRMQDLLGKQEKQARGELDQYFATGEPAARARSEIAQNDVDAAATGMTGSLSNNQRQAAVERGLIRDKANAQLALGQNLRGNVLNQMDQARGANLGLANLFGQSGLGATGQGIGATGQAGQLEQGRVGLGANIAGQGFDQQAKGIGIGSDLGQRDFENRMTRFNTMNQLMQQILANIQGNKQNKYTQEQIKQMQDSMGGGFLGMF